ncbi:type-1 restriction enzyme EcoKI specificity protein [mine drainage metagenome]|uniref:Type-1 restriction enzyme EcoKI specificity protein n=1 Tax=mine drainage metagenome TaxID=410659 RepID=A0A1J5RJV8_9ZZZZ
MNELPHGWNETPLESVVDILDSKRIPLNSDEREQRISGKADHLLFPYYGATGQVGVIDDYLFDGDYILLGEDGVPFFDPLRHKAYRAHGKFWVNNHAHVLQAINGLSDYRFIEKYLNSFDYKGYVSGSTRLKLTQASMRSMPVRLAPYNEQKRIADKLDALLARVDACRDHLDSIPTILKRFRQSVLADATSGKLTEEWRVNQVARMQPQADSGNIVRDSAQTRYAVTPTPDSATLHPGYEATNAFPLVPFGNLVTSIRGGSNEVPSNQVSDFPILRSSSVRQGVVDFSDVKYLTSYQSTNVDNYIENGDVLFTRLNGSVDYVGNCVAVANITSSKYQYPDRIFRAKLKDIILPAYCMYAFSASDVRREIEKRAKSTAGHKRISIQDVKEIEMRLPSILEQTEIVRRVESLFAYAGRLEARYTAARAQVEKLTPATLAKAFRGELVPQDPNDEPATVLLERIRAQRFDQAEDKPKRSRKVTA